MKPTARNKLKQWIEKARDMRSEMAALRMELRVTNAERNHFKSKYNEERKIRAGLFEFGVEHIYQQPYGDVYEMRYRMSEDTLRQTRDPNGLIKYTAELLAWKVREKYMEKNKS